jgi:hypothetical protein
MDYLPPFVNMWFAERPLFDSLKSPRYQPSPEWVKSLEGLMVKAMPKPPSFGNLGTMTNPKLVENERDEVKPDEAVSNLIGNW